MARSAIVVLHRDADTLIVFCRPDATVFFLREYLIRAIPSLVATMSDEPTLKFGD